ncbi:MAG TPA: choice-of-anchor X domain-containing protein [Puia sp.]|nr:choice-of-anchor X domain-containing protein [Puia sp.]
MRTIASSPLFWTAFLVAGVVISSDLVVSCEHDHARRALDTVAVNPAFATDPPIADDLTIQLLDKLSDDGNALLKVTFPKGRIGSPYLAFMAGNKKTVLRDDGLGPDEVKGDGVYTGVVQADLDALREMRRRQIQQNIKEPIPRTVFRGRIVAGTTRIMPTDLKALFEGGLIHVHWPPFPMSKSLTDSIQANSVFVTDPSVIGDTSRTYDPCTNKGHKMGPWTFGFLMTQLANNSATGVSPSRFVLNWLLSYTHTQTVNSDALDARAGMAAFIHTWLVNSNGLLDSTLDLSIAPFRLMAIVNRLDLRSNPGYLGSGGNAGEGRFVFTGLDAGCTAQAFTVIFEYGINKTTCPAIKAYAQHWYDLKDFAIGSPAYNNALQAITDQFTLAGTNSAKPNGSSLDQLRTNETQFGSNWELREFNIDPASHLLFNTTVKQTPQARFNQTTILNTFMTQHAAAIKKNTYTVPLSFEFNGISDTPFLAGMAPVPPGFWAQPGAAATANDTVREMLSLQTCDGCHNIETGTLFRHVSPPLTAGSPALLSGFLVGTTVTDPAEIPGTWKFADLQRRAQDLVDLVNSPCVFIPFHFAPLNMTH